MGRGTCLQSKVEPGPAGGYSGCGLVWSAGAVGKALGIAEILLTGLRASVGFALDICTDDVKAVVRNECLRNPWCRH